MREDGYGFEPDAKGPEDFTGGILVGVDNCQEQRAAEKILDPEGIEVGIVGRLVGCGHQVDGVPARGEEKQFEYCVIGRVGEGPEEVEVAGYIDYKVEGLGFEGDSCAGLFLC